jgi:hypothetical protein
MSLETGPNKPLETSCCTREDDACSSRECQSDKEGEDEVAAKKPEAGR